MKTQVNHANQIYLDLCELIEDFVIPCLNPFTATSWTEGDFIHIIAKIERPKQSL